MEKLHIETMGDVRSFFYYLIHECDLGGGFHPDTPIADYVVVGTGKATFTDPQQVTNLQHGLDKCFEVCERFEQDIYEQGVEPRAYIQMGYAPAPTPEKEDDGGEYNGIGYTFNLDVSAYLEREGLDRMPSDMWDEIEDDVAARAFEMMKEGYFSGELCVSYNDDEFYGWWYSK